jgi:hypothetical protein
MLGSYNVEEKIQYLFDAWFGKIHFDFIDLEQLKF